ncbi:MAG: type VI secretion system Vgr family protein, partial [Acidobacteriota bacterium]
MPPYLQTARRLSVTTQLKDVLLLNGFTGTESISRLFHFQLQCVAEHAKKVPFDALLGQPVTVEVELPGDATKYINGICNRAAQGNRDEVFTEYLLDVVPRFWLLSRKVQSRIYQHISVPDILKKVLTGLDVSWEIQGDFEPRDYCVQYRESDFAFASRLMEEEGIFYFFTHGKGTHKMVVANDKGRHPALTPRSSLIFEAVHGGSRAEDRITSWEKAQELKSGKVTLWDHSFELPHKHLETEARILGAVPAGKSSHTLVLANNDKLELYDYPGAYAQRFDGISKSGAEQPVELQKIFMEKERVAAIRMQEEAAASVLVNGASNVRHLVSGHKFTLERHFEGDGPWVLYQVEHVASESADLRSERGGFSYQNRFSCFPADLPFRPPRVTPRPVVHGTQTAVVVGPPGEEIFTDEYGRIKVQFHWDREGKSDSDSSCWIRVAQPMAGRRWGASFWPRIGQEVIVDFLEGDPDQPIVVGSVYNADQMPPYLGNAPDPKHKNDNRLMGIKSSTTLGGERFNEWRFDDTKGKEQLFLHAERNMDVRVKRDSMERVGGSKHLIVGGEKDGEKWGDYSELVYRDVSLHNKRDLQQLVGGDMNLTVGKEEGKGNFDLVVKKDRTTFIGKDDRLSVQGDRVEEVKGGLHLRISG